MPKNYILIITLLILCSCGKSKEEIELEKAQIELEKIKIELNNKTKQDKENNLKLEKENNISKKKAEVDRIHEQKVNVGKRKKITELTLMLQKLPEAVEKAEKNIIQINEFQLGRSSSSKNQQLNDAKKKLEEIYDSGNKIKNEIAESEYLRTFEFQKDPVSVMNYIFNSAKKGDFSNFRNLCDPYGENENDVNNLCYAEILMEKEKDNLKSEFENGRVVGKAKIKGDQAEVEFAFGQSANRLEKMQFVNRNGLWYLSGM